MIGSFVFAQERFIVELWSRNRLLLIQTVERCGHAVLRCLTTLSRSVPGLRGHYPMDEAEG